MNFIRRLFTTSQQMDDRGEPAIPVEPKPSINSWSKKVARVKEETEEERKARLNKIAQVIAAECDFDDILTKAGMESAMFSSDSEWEDSADTFSTSTTPKRVQRRSRSSSPRSPRPSRTTPAAVPASRSRSCTFLASDIPGLPLLSDGSEDQQTTSLESSDMSTNIDTKEIRMLLDMSDETLLRTIMDQRAERHAFKRSASSESDESLPPELFIGTQATPSQKTRRPKRRSCRAAGKGTKRGKRANVGEDFFAINALIDELTSSDSSGEEDETTSPSMELLAKTLRRAVSNDAIPRAVLEDLIIDELVACQRANPGLTLQQISHKLTGPVLRLCKVMPEAVRSVRDPVNKEARCPKPCPTPNSASDEEDVVSGYTSGQRTNSHCPASESEPGDRQPFNHAMPRKEFYLSSPPKVNVARGFSNTSSDYLDEELAMDPAFVEEHYLKRMTPEQRSAFVSQFSSEADFILLNNTSDEVQRAVDEKAVAGCGDGHQKANKTLELDSTFVKEHYLKKLTTPEQRNEFLSQFSSDAEIVFTSSKNSSESSRQRRNSTIADLGDELADIEYFEDSESLKLAAGLLRPAGTEPFSLRNSFLIPSGTSSCQDIDKTLIVESRNMFECPSSTSIDQPARTQSTANQILADQLQLALLEAEEETKRELAAVEQGPLISGRGDSFEVHGRQSQGRQSSAAVNSREMLFEVKSGLATPQRLSKSPSMVSQVSIEINFKDATVSISKCTEDAHKSRVYNNGLHHDEQDSEKSMNSYIRDLQAASVHSAKMADVSVSQMSVATSGTQTAYLNRQKSLHTMSADLLSQQPSRVYNLEETRSVTSRGTPARNPPSRMLSTDTMAPISIRTDMTVSRAETELVSHLNDRARQVSKDQIAFNERGNAEGSLLSPAPSRSALKAAKSLSNGLLRKPSPGLLEQRKSRVSFSAQSLAASRKNSATGKAKMSPSLASLQAAALARSRQSIASAVLKRPAMAGVRRKQPVKVTPKKAAPAKQAQLQVVKRLPSPRPPVQGQVKPGATRTPAVGQRSFSNLPPKKSPSPTPRKKVAVTGTAGKPAGNVVKPGTKPKDAVNKEPLKKAQRAPASGDTQGNKPSGAAGPQKTPAGARPGAAKPGAGGASGDTQAPGKKPAGVLLRGKREMSASMPSVATKTAGKAAATNLQKQKSRSVAVELNKAPLASAGLRKPSTVGDQATKKPASGAPGETKTTVAQDQKKPTSGAPAAAVQQKPTSGAPAPNVKPKPLGTQQTSSVSSTTASRIPISAASNATRTIKKPSMIPRLSVPRSVKAAPLQPTIKRMAAAGSSAAPQPTAKKPAGNTSAGVVKKSPASGLKAKGMPAAQANKPAPAAKPNKAAPPALKTTAKGPAAGVKQTPASSTKPTLALK